MSKLSEHYTAPMLLRYTLPVMAMMLVESAYSIVDGLFVSNVVGKEALASVTIVMPFVMALSAVGMMMGAGGSAVVGQLLGAGKIQEARESFSSLACFTFLAGVAASVLGFVFMDAVVRLLGASPQIAPAAALYGRVAFLSLPMFMLQYLFELFSAASGRPGLGLASSVIAGVTNIALDALFMLVFGWGIAGAAAATCVAEYVAGAFMAIMFLTGRAGALRLVRPVGDAKLLGRTAFNGLSEMVGTLALSVVAIAYNLQLMRLFGPDGVAAYAVTEFASMMAGAMLGGLTEGVAPLMSYQHGAGNREEKGSLFRKGLLLTCLMGALAFGFAQLLARPLVLVFASYDQGLMALAENALRVYSISYLLMGFTYFTSSMFTAVENGKISALVALAHTFVFEVGSVILLPMLLGPDGVWWAIVIAELAATALSGLLISRHEVQYDWR